MTDQKPQRDARKIHVPAPGAGPSGPPPRPGTPPRSRPARPPADRTSRPPASTAARPPADTAARPPADSAARPPADTAARPPADSAPRPPADSAPRPPADSARRPQRVNVAAPSTTEAKAPPRTAAPERPTPPRTKRSRRPRLRRIVRLTALFLPLLLLLAVLAGWLYARSVYNRVEKIPLEEVLATTGSGTNYLIVGSDSRNVEDLIDAGLDPAGFAEGGGQRSDTMLLLRFVDGQAKMMSIPRDLYVPIAETDGSSKINAAYNGGPRRLVLTVQESLGIPVHHYLEVDFVSFARLVDSLGGITIDFPHPAFDTQSGLDVKEAGAVELDGPQSLAYVRSRHYTEVIDGDTRTDPTADLGRVQRQQQFLSAVFGKLGDSRNPITLARAASSASGGLRVDDTLGLTDAIRLAWRLRSLDPEPVELPVRMGSNRSGSVLFLVEPDADAALDQFR